MTHWATQYIGIPWVRGAVGPDAYYCWSFFRHVQAAHYGVEVAEISMPDSWVEANQLLEHSDERGQWVEVQKPFDGCAVMMARTRIPVHIGLWVVAGPVHGVLHCAEPVGVVYQTLHSLRVSGWGRLTYYRHIQ